MDRYHVALKKENDSSITETKTRTKVYNSDIDIQIQKVDPIAGDILFVQATSSDFLQMKELNDLVKNSVEEGVKIICVNSPLKINLIKAPQKGNALFISAPKIPDEELDEFTKVIQKEIGRVDYKIVITNDDVDVKESKDEIPADINDYGNKND